MIIRDYLFPLNFHGTIFDVETTHLSPTMGELITIGYFTGDGSIRISQRDDLDGSGLEKLEELKRGLDTLPHPYMSYNKDFEEQWLDFELDFDMMTKWKELCEDIKMPGYMYCSKDKWVVPTTEGLCPDCGGWLYSTIKWPKSSELISLPHSYFFRSDVKGKEIPRIWRRYLDTEDKRLLEIIMFHNLNDLVRNYCLYIWDGTIAELISKKLKESAEKPKSLYELIMGKK